MNSVGERIKSARKAKGLNQLALSRLCDVSQATISDYESGVGKVFNAAFLIQIASALDTTSDYLMTGQGDVPLGSERKDTEINARRVKNLIGLTTEFRSKAEFSRVYSLDPTYISQLINGQRNLGEKTARRIELAVGKPEGWLDQEILLAEQDVNDELSAVIQSLEKTNQHILLDVAKTLKRHQRPPEVSRTLEKIKKLLGEDK